MMRDRNVGSLLIMSPSQPEELVGIFTERDLLKWIDEIQHGGHWTKPVAHLMSRHLKTITASKLSDSVTEAAELMLTHKIRQLPVVHDAPRTREHLIGVISMRDVLARQLHLAQNVSGDLSGARTKRLNKRRKSKITFFCDGTSPRKVQFAALKTMGRDFKALWEPRALTPASVQADEHETSDLIIGDLDGVSPKVWAPFLKKMHESETAPPMILLLTESLHPRPTVQALQNYAKAGHWPVFAKPVAVYDFLDQIKKLLED